VFFLLLLWDAASHFCYLVFFNKARRIGIQRVSGKKAEIKELKQDLLFITLFLFVTIFAMDIVFPNKAPL
jgi:hypothetical protein